MPGRDIGVVLDGFRLPAREALQSAARLGFRQVELPAASGEVDPAQLSRSGRRHLLHYVDGLGLTLAALGGDLGGPRFGDAAQLEQRLDKTRQIMELAAELKVPAVTTHLGAIDPDGLQHGHLREAVDRLAEFSDRTGTRLAVETTAEPAVIADLLREVDCPSLGACYDPASLLIHGFDPLAGLGALADRIQVAHVCDALAGSGDRPGRETPIGRGQIDLAAYLAGLELAGARSVPLVRRSQPEDPLGEMADAKARIESLLP